LLKSDVLPVLYTQTVADPSLVRQADYGCFKVPVDDGLPLRRATFQCLHTLLESAPHRIPDMKQYLNEVKKGLNDHDDIQIVTYNILQTTALNHSAMLLQVIEDLPDPIMKSVKLKLKESKASEDKDKDGSAGANTAEHAKDVLRAAVRSLFAMRHMAGVDPSTSPKFCEFYLRVLQTQLLAKMLSELNGGVA